MVPPAFLRWGGGEDKLDHRPVCEAGGTGGSLADRNLDAAFQKGGTGWQGRGSHWSNLSSSTGRCTCMSLGGAPWFKQIQIKSRPNPKS